MKRRVLFILSTIIAIISCVAVYTICVGDTYNIYLPKTCDAKNINVSIDDESILKCTGIFNAGKYMGVRFKSQHKGTTGVSIENSYNGTKYAYTLSVRKFGVITSSGAAWDHNGWQLNLIGEIVFFGILSVYFFMNSRKNIRDSLYSYRTILDLGFFITCVCMTILFMVTSFIVFLNMHGYTPSVVLNITNNIMYFFILCTLPFVMIFLISMTVSNIALIRHEGMTPLNLLGVFMGIALLIGAVMPILAMFVGSNSDVVYRIKTSTQFAYSAVYSFFESMFLATMICGLTAAVRKSSYDKDYIVILGCGIRKDGSLTPLLKGRVDRAVEFYNEQLKSTGHKAFFVPSGGQGNDEIIPEAEAMKNYLVDIGVDEKQILPETNSVNTLQNMKFSKEIIEKHSDGNSNVVFSTTNYHVFRSGILSVQAGLRADGIGSPTKWYFWPNAFMREFIGLLVKFRKLELMIFVIIAVISGMISVVIG